MEYGYLETMSKFVDLKPRGYELRGPLSESQLSTLMRVLKKGDSRSMHLERSSRKYSTLKCLEQVKSKLDFLEIYPVSMCCDSCGGSS
ncbi:hypothetical protein Cantr_08934 [Candida viswanathii]|uniref:Uncharacterized protein n=1 Tax=Candida viswanathii TaxID=5486 RepID=A0A367Y9Q2_9ASCO|nr:hypothetical protein Cantr_08934 [Candida viswanathii]